MYTQAICTACDNRDLIFSYPNLYFMANENCGQLLWKSMQTVLDEEILGTLEHLANGSMYFIYIYPEYTTRAC